MSNEMHIIDEVYENNIKLDISVVSSIDVLEWVDASKDIYGCEYREIIIELLNTLDLNNRGFDFIIVKYDNKIIGRAIVNPIENNTHNINLMGFIIDYEYRGMGIGNILMEFIKIKYKHITLIYTTTNTVMVSLGFKTGFTILKNDIDTVINQPCKCMILKDRII